MRRSIACAVFVSLIACLALPSPATAQTQEAPSPATAQTQEAPTAPRDGVVLDGGTFGVLFKKDPNAIFVYSAEDGVWSRHEWEAGVVAVPVITSGGGGFAPSSDGVCGFRLSGDAVTELVAVDSRGRIGVHKLEAPSKETFIPILYGNGIILYVTDAKIYAFSGTTATWGVLEAPYPPDAEAKAAAEKAGYLSGPSWLRVMSGKLLVAGPDRAWAFSAETGKWTSTSYDAETN